MSEVVVFPTDREAKRRFLLDAVRDVADVIRAEADASEEGATLTMPMVRALQAAGLFRMKLPAVLGGAEADPVTQMEVIEALVGIYPSAGWVVMTNATVVGSAGAMLPDDAIAEMFAGGRIPRAAGAGAPSGVAVPVEGGFRLTGRWSFSSGSPHADYISLGVRVADGADAGEIRTFIIPYANITRHENWQVAGLKGTGSCDISADDLFVPERYTWVRYEGLRGWPRRGGAIFLLRGPGFVSNEHAAVALGIAQRALNLIVDTSQTKRRGRGAAAVTLVDRPGVPALGAARPTFACAPARKVAHDVHERAWEVVCGGVQTEPELDAEMRASAVYCTDVASEIVTQAFRYGGGAALHLENGLQQCLRDVDAAAQHLAVSDVAYENHGKFVLGLSEASPLY